MDKSAIKKFATWARVELIKQVSQKASEYRVQPNSMPEDIDTDANDQLLKETEKSQRKSLIAKIKEKGFEQVMEEVAYTWFNRFCALRFMEVNGYIPSHVRIFTDVENKFDPQILTEAIHLEIAGIDKEYIFELKEENKKDELYKYLLIKQCNELSKFLPKMFETISDYTELLLPDNLLKSGSVIDQMIQLIPEEDWTDAVQIIGWLYQYYIDEKHNQIVNIYKGVVEKEDIPAATQLFTTDWVVRYMVDNSIGRYWIERFPNSNLSDKLDFYVKSKNKETIVLNENITPQDVTFFDPCMGSGHILAYAFDVLMEIYKEYGYTERESVSEIVKNNIYGLDIDKRCTQLAYFVIMMKARQYDRRFFTRGIEPQVYCPIEDEELEEYGSLVCVDQLEEKPQLPEEVLTFDDIHFEEKVNNWNFRRLLSQKYAVVCTNPPYLNKYNKKLKGFVQKNYKDYSGDLFSIFIYKNFEFCKQNGYSAFMTPFVWMFIKTYEKLRDYIIVNKSITSLIQMEYSAFEEATVPICSFVLKNGKETNEGLYFRLSDFKGGMEVQKQKVLEALKNQDCGYFYETPQSNFSKIPGSPIAYWVSKKFLKIFENGIPLDDIAEIVTGVSTGKNDLYLRRWYEVDFSRISIYQENIDTIDFDIKKWIPYNKGGDFRKWYGNNDYIVKWSESKKFHRSRPTYKHLYLKSGITWSFVTSGTFSSRYYPQGFLWDVAGSPCVMNDLSLLLYTQACLSTNVVNQIVKIINPTINCQVDDVKRIPIFIDRDKINQVSQYSKININLSKEDWDSFETSWDFITHPLIKYKSGSGYADTPIDEWQYKIEDAFKCWESNAQAQFDLLKANEEELNRIFIDIYGLQDELTPEVEDKDVSLKINPIYRYKEKKKKQKKNEIYFDKDEEILVSTEVGKIKFLNSAITELISYAVGCMFGRYSLDIDGLAYAGGEWNDTKYKSFPVDKDNIIPICDDEYFEDDIVGKFIEFIKTVYGEKYLDDNLNFIAKALGGKGDAKKVIRNYFINSFYSDHCKAYQKRPIYWLFDSGKKNGFKALIYMHRYQPDTIARIRTDYVHEQQSRYQTAIEDIQQRIDNVSSSEKTKLSKKLQNLKDQATEIREYEEKIHHLADQMISIDLDDGVKINYDKFKDVLAKIK